MIDLLPDPGDPPAGTTRADQAPRSRRIIPKSGAPGASPPAATGAAMRGARCGSERAYSTGVARPRGWRLGRVRWERWITPLSDGGEPNRPTVECASGNSRTPGDAASPLQPDESAARDVAAIRWGTIAPSCLDRSAGQSLMPLGRHQPSPRTSTLTWFATTMSHETTEAAPRVGRGPLTWCIASTICSTCGASRGEPSSASVPPAASPGPTSTSARRRSGRPRRSAAGSTAAVTVERRQGPPAAHENRPGRNAKIGARSSRSPRRDASMAALRKYGQVRYSRCTDADGAKRECKDCTDQCDTERLTIEAEVARIKARPIEPKALGHCHHEAQRLDEHRADWLRDMDVRGKAGMCAGQLHKRTGKLAALGGGAILDGFDPGRKPGDQRSTACVLADGLQAACRSDLVPDRIQAALGRLRDAGKAHQTVNHYHAALRAFARWAWENGRICDNPMHGVKGFNVEEERRHERWSRADNELGGLTLAPNSGPLACRTSGPLRAMACRLTAVTGLRAEELRAPTPRSSRLAGSEPSIRLKVRSARSRRAVEPPPAIAPVSDLAARSDARPAGLPVLPLHHDAARAIRVGRQAASIPHETEEGVADFHSLRTSHVSGLIQSGASIKERRGRPWPATPNPRRRSTTMPRWASATPGGRRDAPHARPRRVGSRAFDGHWNDPRGPDPFPPFSHRWVRF